jgi:hypothetical protein
MVFIVLMVSTSDCDSVSIGSNPIKHPKVDSEAVMIFSRLKHEKGFRVV